VPAGSSALRVQANAMEAGQWIELTTTGLTPAMFRDGANNTLDYMDKGAYDPIGKQIRFIGQSHYGDQRWHSYDEPSNTWATLPDPPWDTGGAAYPNFIGHGYQHNTVDPATGDFFYRQFGATQPRAFQRSTGTWSQLPASQATSIAGGLEWLPSIGAQGGLILHAGSEVHRWDKAANAWTRFTGLSGAGPYHNTALRSVPHGVCLLGGGNNSNKLWKIAGSAGPVSCADSPETFGIGQSITTADPVSGDLIIIKSNSAAYGYSVTSNTWYAMNMANAPVFGAINSGSKIMAIPIAAYGVVMFLFGNAAKVYLYKHR
jgi:hypothetical protein